MFKSKSPNLNTSQGTQPHQMEVLLRNHCEVRNKTRLTGRINFIKKTFILKKGFFHPCTQGSLKFAQNPTYAGLIMKCASQIANSF